MNYTEPPHRPQPASPRRPAPSGRQRTLIVGVGAFVAGAAITGYLAVTYMRGHLADKRVPAGTHTGFAPRGPWHAQGMRLDPAEVSNIEDHRGEGGSGLARDLGGRATPPHRRLEDLARGGPDDAGHPPRWRLCNGPPRTPDWHCDHWRAGRPLDDSDAAPPPPPHGRAHR